MPDRREGVGDLLGELAGRYEDEATRTTRCTSLRGEPGDQGKAERERLAGAGLAAREDVAARQGVGQAARLDGEGCRETLAGQHGDEGLGEAVAVEVLDDRRRLRGSCRQGAVEAALGRDLGELLGAAAARG